MNRSLCKVRLVYSARPALRGRLRLTPADAERLGVTHGRVIAVRMGSWRGQFGVTVSSAAKDSAVEMPRRAPRIPIRSVTLYRAPAGDIHLGPVIGIMTMFRKKGGRITNNQMSTYVELMQKARALNGVAFVFQPRLSTAKKGWVQGWVRVKRRWHAARFPLPDVVYNRVQSRPLERRLRSRGVMRRFTARGIPLFNPHYLAKWSVHQALMQAPEVQRFLPETRRFRSLDDVRALLKRHGRVFFKPSNGTLGLGAMLLVRQPNGELTYSMNTMSGRKQSGRLSSLTSLTRLLPNRRDYLVQQGIPLAQFQGRSFDVRALVQRDVDDRWHFSGAAARVAGKGRITTHVPRGGSRRPLRQVLEAAFGSERVEEITERLREACLKAAIALEQTTGERFGELSLDVGIDENGAGWILEMNAKPFRFDELRLRERSQKRLIRYASHLSGCSVPIEEPSPLGRESL